MLEALEPRLLLSLVAHLELNETSGTTAADTVSNHDGTLYGAAAWDDGRIDNGTYFDGDDDYIDLANSNDFDFGASTSFTVSAWVRDDGDGHYAMAVNRGNRVAGASTSQGAGWAFGHYTANPGQFFFGITDGSNQVNYTGAQVYEPSFFHLLTMVVDRSADEMYCYIDGALAGTVGISSIGSIDSTGEALQIGVGNTKWKGMVDDVRVYDEALSANDVETLYNDAPTWALVSTTDSTAIEDDGDTASFHIHRTGDTTGAQVVNYSVSGTASSGDYSETLGGSVTIADGESYVDVTITPVDDAADNAETLTLTIAAGTGYTAGNSSEATITIFDEGQMLAHWKMDESSGTTASDDVGDHDGTRYGDSGWDDGRIDNGAYFDGLGDSIEAPNDVSDFDFGASQSFTISAWVRNDDPANSSVVSRGHTFWSGLGYGACTKGPGWCVGTKSEGEYFYTISDGIHGTYSATYTPSNPGGYHLMTMVVDRSTQQMYCYADDVLFSTKSLSSIGSVSCSADSVLFIGGQTTWEGIIDDVRVYNCALDSTDIEDLYEAGLPGITLVAVDDTAYESSSEGAVFRFYRPDTLGPLEINYSVSGTASSADYSETLSGTVTMADGESYVDITITPVMDGADDGETLVLTLVTGTGYQLGNPTEATVTFYDTDCLMAHMELNETSGSTAGDSAGNHDGTLYYDTSWDDGRIDNGAYFDGDGDYIDLANSDDFDFGASTSFTISAWIRDDGDGNGAMAVNRGNRVAGSSTSQGAGWAFGHYASDPGRFFFGFTDGSNQVNYTGTEIYEPELFHLLTMVVDRSAAEMYCYIDGALEGTVDISSIGSIDSTGEALQIGVGNTKWKGMVDDVRVYSMALSANDVRSLYNNAPTWALVSATDSTAIEDDGDTATFRIYRTGDTDGAQVVNYSVSGTASSGDYSETLGGSVTIADGESYVDIAITPVDDAADNAETLTLTIAAGTGYTAGNSSEATITIFDEGQMLAHWKMDETSGTTASDDVGDHDGTRYGDSAWDDGRIDNGAYFDGLGDSMEVSNSSEFDFGASQSFTISAWVRDDDSGDSSVVCRGHTFWSGLGWGPSKEGPGWCVGTKSSGEYFYTISDGVHGTYSGTYTPSNPSGYHLMTMVVDRSTQQMYCYADDVLFSTISITAIGSVSCSADSPLLIGGRTTWEGIIDDVRVYNCALDSTDIENLYDAATPAITIVATDSTTYEGTSDTATFRISRATIGGATTNGALTVNYTVSGTASSADYSETLSGTVTIADGESYADITITPVDDAADDGETLVLTVVSGNDYQVGDPEEATVTLYDSPSILAQLELNETSGSTADDSVGNHDGTLYGDTAWDNGRIDNGVYLDGDGDYIDVANSNDFDFGASTSFTVSAWVRDDGDGSGAMAVSRGNRVAGTSTSQGAGWAFGHYTSDPGRFYFGITDGSNQKNYTGTEIYEPGFFHLLTMVVDRSAAEMYCYIDGALAGTVDISSIGNIDSTGEALQIGIGNENWKGVVDDVRVYDEALAADYVELLYNEAPTWALISATDGAAIEDDGDTASFRIYRTGDTDGAQVVNYSVSGTASSGDYSETLGGSVTIADGESYVDVTITPVDDAVDNAETLTLTIAAGTGYTAGNSSEATITIYDEGQLLAHWKMDETSGTTASDDVGDHDGTRYGDSGWDDGRIGNGAYFDGLGDSIEVSNSSDFDFGASQSFTISAWVRDDDPGDSSIVCRGNTYWSGLGWGACTEGPGWCVGTKSTDGAYFYTISDGVHGTYSDVYNPSTPSDGYRLLTMVVDRSTQQMYCYVDDVLFSTKSITAIGSVSCSADSPLLIGGRTTWEGIIDDVRVYNHALAGAEVEDLYHDVPTWVTIVASDAIANEDAVGTDTAKFHLLRTGSLSGAITVNYSVSGTASSADYSETLGGTVTIGDGESEVDIVVTPVEDGTADDGETLTLTLAAGTGYEVSDIDSGTVTFYDEAGLLAHWKLDETSGSTAADATGNGFTGARSGDTVWTYGRIGNGAYFDGVGDYITVANATGIDFGEDQSFTISTWIRDDGNASNRPLVYKGNSMAHYGETGEGLGWSLGRNGTSFYFGITDGLTAENITMPSYYGDDALHLVTMVVDRGADLLRAYADGELITQNDISAIGSLASFAESLCIGNGDYLWKGIVDDMRVYDCALTSSQIANLYAATSPMVSIAAWDATASETGSTTGIFRVTREGYRSEPLAVNYSISGTATGADYSETLSGTVTIAAGESYADIVITPVDDASNEGDETVIATLTASPDDYAVINGTATVTIGDSDNVSDPQVVITATDSEAGEADSNTGTFRVYRSGATTSDLAVNYTVSGTADSSDYSETLSGTVTIASGNSYADITITPVEDTNFEYPEVLVLTLTEDVSYTIGLSDEAAIAMVDVPFNEQLNPTGDPIGGGEGYSDIIDIGDADYVVDTAGELIDVLSSATYGDIVYVEDDAEIDLTGYIADTSYNAVFIPSGVTLASGRGNNGSAGALIYTTDSWTDTNRVAMLGTGGDDVRVTGLRLQGPSGFFPDDCSEGRAIGIRCSHNLANPYHENAIVDNCEIYNWSMAGVYVMYGEGVEVHHNFIHTNINDGYSYGIWFGGLVDTSAEWVAEAEANLFNCNRHDIGSACHWPWAARYNIFGPDQYQQILDRHVGTSLDTWIENNWCQADGGTWSYPEVRLAFNTDSGGTVYYNNNWTPRETIGPNTNESVFYVPYYPYNFVTEASGNVFSFDKQDDDYTPVAASTVTYQSTPLTVSFDSSNSYDPQGNDIVAHQWWLDEGADVQGIVSYEDNPTYTFSEPGMYQVIHYAYNEYGVPGVETIPVMVRPADDGYWLSAWVWDESSPTITTGIYQKQIYIDDQLVWSDDVYGDDEWQHVVVDISEYVTEGTAARLSFRLASLSDPTGYQANMVIDDVYIFGGDVAAGEMGKGTWLEVDPDGAGSDWGISGSTLIGRLATKGSKIISWGAAGTGELYQMVPIGKALEPMVTDDFESGDGTGGENWDANWVLTGSAVTSSGTPYNGTYHLLLTGSSAVASRAVDLSDYGDDVTLSFQYMADSFEAGEEVSVEIYDGTQWQEVVVVEDGDDDGEYHLASIDLSGYSLTDDFEVRFTASLADASDFFYVDDLMIA